MISCSGLSSVATAVLIICCPAVRPVVAQVPSPSVSVGFGVDTTISDVRNIVGLVRAYLAKPDSSARSRGLWGVSTEFDRRVGDIAGGTANQGLPATVVAAFPASLGDSVYVVKILYARADSVRGVLPLALERLYALRESGGPFTFKLSSALPRLTKDWDRHSTKRITFWYEPGQRPNPERINRASHFVDSVARLFEVNPPQHLDVYIVKSFEDIYRTIGLDFFPQPSGPGEGRGGLNLGSGVLMVGNPAIGEAYFHEFVHAVLHDLPAGSALLAEGVATWLGGSQGRTPHEMYVLLNNYLQAHASLTLSGLLKSGFETGAKTGTDLRYATGALIVEALYRKEGIGGVRKFYQIKGDNETLLRELAVQLKLREANDAALDNWWRNEAILASGKSDR